MECGEYLVGIYKKVIILILLTLLVGGCGKHERQQTHDMRVGIENRPKTLDPRFATDVYGMRITHHLLFSTLVKLDNDLQIVPDLAEKWATPDSSTYIFHLKNNVVFHDNSPLTAKDVKFTFEHLMDPAVKSPFAATYKGIIDRIDVIDPHTVQFHLVKPVASFLTSIIMPILPEHLLNKGNFDGKLIGSGPFKFISQTPNEIVLGPNEKYYGGTPKPDKLIFKVVSDDNTRFLKMKKGELDLVINAIPAGKVDDFKKPPLSDTYNLIEEPGIAYSYLSFNMADKIVQDIRIRQAIGFGIDVDEIIANRLHGHAIRATGLLSPVNWFADKEITAIPYDPEKAKKLLEEAGFSDPDGDGPEPRVVLELKTSNNIQAVGNARIIQAQLARIGIRLDIKSYEWGTFYGDIQSGNFQLTLMQWVGVTEPDFYYDIFHSSQVPPVGRNRGRYVNKELDPLLKDGRYTLNPAKRKDIYAKVQQIIADDLPYISLWHANNITIIKKRISGYRQHPMAGYYSFKDISLQD